MRQRCGLLLSPRHASSLCLTSVVTRTSHAILVTHMASAVTYPPSKHQDGATLMKVLAFVLAFNSPLSAKRSSRLLKPERMLRASVVHSQVGEDAHVMLNGFGTVINALGRRAKPYLPQVCGTIKWRLNNKSAKIRQQAADLIARIAPVMKQCEEEQLLGHLGE